MDILLQDLHAFLSKEVTLEVSSQTSAKNCAHTITDPI
jgi:hypothetical protein